MPDERSRDSRILDRLEFRGGQFNGPEGRSIARNRRALVVIGLPGSGKMRLVVEPWAKANQASFLENSSKLDKAGYRIELVHHDVPIDVA